MSYLPALIGFDEALQQLNITTDQTDLFADIKMKVDQSSAIVYQWMKLDAVPDEWLVPNTSPILMKVPLDVKALTLVILGELYLNRESSVSNIMPETVKTWARQFRDPTVA